MQASMYIMEGTDAQIGSGIFNSLYKLFDEYKNSVNLCKGKKVLVIKFESLLNHDFNKFITNNKIDYKNNTQLENNKISNMYNKLIDNIFFKNVINAKSEILLKIALNQYYKNVVLKHDIKNVYYFIYYFFGNDERYNNIKKLFMEIKKQNSVLCVISGLEYNKIEFILYLSKVYDSYLAVANKVKVDEMSYLLNNINRKNIFSINSNIVYMYENEIISNINKKDFGCILHITDNIKSVNLNSKLNYIYYGKNKGLDSSKALTNSMINEISKIFINSTMKGGNSDTSIHNNSYDGKYYKKYLKYKQKYLMIKS